MPPSGPLKAVPRQDLCLFCVFRLLSRPSNQRTPSHARRWISSSRQTSQFAGAVASRKVDDDGESPFTTPSANSNPPAVVARWHDRTTNGQRYRVGRPEETYTTRSQFRVQVQDQESSGTRRSDTQSQFNPKISAGWKWQGVRRAQVHSPPSSTPQVDQETERPLIRRVQSGDGAFVSFGAPAARTCYICKEKGHTADQCPQRSRKVQWTTTKPRFQPESEEFSASRPSRDNLGAKYQRPEPATVEATNVGFAPSRLEEVRRRERRSHNRASRWEGGEEQEERRGWDRNRERQMNRQSSRDEGFDDVDYERIEAKRQRKLQRQRIKAKEAAAQAREAATHVSLPEHISVANLAVLLKIRGESLARKMTSMGYSDVAYDHVLNAENASLIAMELGFEPTSQSQSRAQEEDLHAAPLPADLSSLPLRPPVVTIMGHVDHGKTTLLDHLRQSSIAASEHGGITQHIGAFVVPLPHHAGKTITFLDTPGHAAFLAMRRRGAAVTDIVVLAVAADDSVKPQTAEAVAHARGAGVPLVVAVTKADKPDADPARVKADLARLGVDVEDFGGDVQAVAVSGKTGAGMRALEDAVVALAEVLEKRAPVDGVVEGWVLEACTKRSGRAATVLVRRGTLRVGDVIVAGTAWARVRTLRNEFGVAVEEAGPGTPVEVDGWRGEPGAGDEVLQAPSEEKAGDVVKYRESIVERKKLSDDMEAINAIRKIKQEQRHKEEAEERAKKLGAWDVYGEEESKTAEEEASPVTTEVPFIVKADVAGSAEAVVNSISAIGNNEVRTKILRSGVGAVSEFDVEHASVAEGHIIAFNTRVDPSIMQLAAREGVRIVDQSIIYRVVEQVTDMLSEKLPDKIIQSVIGEAEIAQMFSISISGRKKMKIAGCKVRNGVIRLGSKARVIRGGKTIYDGNVSSLKSVKKDVIEMRKDTECGMGFSEWEDFQVGDRVQCYEESTEKRSLNGTT